MQSQSDFGSFFSQIFPNLFQLKGLNEQKRRKNSLPAAKEIKLLRSFQAFKRMWRCFCTHFGFPGCKFSVANWTLCGKSAPSQSVLTLHSFGVPFLRPTKSVTIGSACYWTIKKLFSSDQLKLINQLIVWRQIWYLFAPTQKKVIFNLSKITMGNTKPSQ